MDVLFRLIEAKDDPAMQEIIVRVLTGEYGRSGEGFSVSDAEVSAMSRSYNAPRSKYWVIEKEGVIVGGGGYAPLTGAAPEVCELRKMYLLPEGRGQGFGAKLIELVLSQAREDGFQICYLETLDDMIEAQGLYTKFGFRKLDAPMGNTGHCGCHAWFAKEI